jgi:hypothetical protein
MSPLPIIKVVKLRQYKPLSILRYVSRHSTITIAATTL